jgi:hypothetical protein
MLRFDLAKVARALAEVETAWPRIEAELRRLRLGSKAPFTSRLRCNMVSAYAYVDELLGEGVEPFSDVGMEHMLTLNLRVHYGDDNRLISQFASAIEANIDKFNSNIEVIANWYWRHLRCGDHPYKLAAETYVSIVGQPQLFLEGNHRTAALIGSWIGMRANYPPFVLSVDNAIAYFAPSAEIKQFADRTRWRGRRQLPRYREAFRIFWERHVDSTYVRDLFHSD